MAEGSEIKLEVSENAEGGELVKEASKEPVITITTSTSKSSKKVCSLTEMSLQTCRVMQSSLLHTQKKKKGGGKEDASGAAKAAAKNAGAPMTTKNLQQLLSKMTVDDQKKEHKFWNTQPVPKLGTIKCRS